MYFQTICLLLTISMIYNPVRALLNFPQKFGGITGDTSVHEADYNAITG